MKFESSVGFSKGWVVFCQKKPPNSRNQVFEPDFLSGGSAVIWQRSSVPTYRAAQSMALSTISRASGTSKSLFVWPQQATNTLPLPHVLV
jgi:hypothetical protein